MAAGGVLRETVFGTQRGVAQELPRWWGSILGTQTLSGGSVADFIYTELGEVEWCVFIYTNFSGGCMVKKAYKKKRYILVLVKTLSRRAG